MQYITENEKKDSKATPKQPVKQGNNTALFVPHLLISFEEVFIFKVPLYVNIMLNCTVESPQTIAASKKNQAFKQQTI